MKSLSHDQQVTYIIDRLDMLHWYVIATHQIKNREGVTSSRPLTKYHLARINRHMRKRYDQTYISLCKNADFTYPSTMKEIISDAQGPEIKPKGTILKTINSWNDLNRIFVTNNICMNCFHHALEVESHRFTHDELRSLLLLIRETLR